MDEGCALGGEVNGATAGRYTGFNPGQAVEYFDGLLVFEGNVLLARDREPIDLQPGGEVDGKAADFVVAVVADGDVVVTDGGVVFDDVREEARDLVREIQAPLEA